MYHDLRRLVNEARVPPEHHARPKEDSFSTTDDRSTVKLVAAHLEDGDEVLVGVVPGPLIEALTTLNDNKWRERIAVPCRNSTGEVVLDSKCGRHHRFELRMHVQVPLSLERLPIEIELYCCLNSNWHHESQVNLPSHPGQQQTGIEAKRKGPLESPFAQRCLLLSALCGMACCPHNRTVRGRWDSSYRQSPLLGPRRFCHCI